MWALARLPRPAAIPGFMRELKRRHVLRVAFGYATVSWLVLQVSTALLPPLHVPAWAVSLIAVLLILGFPVALVLAWAYDLTPDGVRRTRGHAGAAAVAEPRPLAVAALPFVDRSPGGGHQYLADGLADELINTLAAATELHVASRTSAFALRGEPLDVREIGRRLGVAHVIEGALHVAGGRLRITVQLVDARAGYTVWSASYDRRLDDLLIVQEEVARAIAGALSCRLEPRTGAAAPCDEAAPLTGAPSSVDAYTLYLKGRALWNERTPDALRAAIEAFERAVAIDPRFARAYAGLADAYAILLDYGVVAPADGLARARAAARDALALGSGLAEVHTSAALVRQLDWRWARAEASFRAALELDAGYSIARQRLALQLAWTARIAEARAEIARAEELDPLSPAIAASRGWIEYYAGEHSAAEAILRDVLDQHAAFAPARTALALTLLARGRAADAVVELVRAGDLADASTAASALLVYARARAGETDAARRRLEVLHERARSGYVSGYDLALAHLGLRDAHAAIAQLERAATERAPQLAYLRVDPIWAELRGDPAFQRVLERVHPDADAAQ